MTEQPDTAEYRDYADMLVGSAPKAIRALCDALDAARAERDQLATESRANAERLIARAGAAEAELSDLRREGDWKANQAWARCSHAHKAAEAAEARIAAVLAMHVRTIDPWDCDSCERFWPCPTVQALLP